jgi:drug/metabolite transporter (DMT)-like permease
MLSPRRRSDLGLLLVTAIWGLTFPAIRTAMTEGATPLAFVGVRFAIALLLMLPFALPGFRKHGSAMVAPSVGLGLLLGGGYAMQTIGMTTTTAANSGFIAGTAVIMVPFIDALLRKTEISPWVVGGAALATCGLYLLSGIEDLRSLAAGRPGDLWTLASSASYAFYLVLLQDHLPRFGHWPFLTAQLIVVCASALLLAPLVEEPRLDPNGAVILALVFCAVFATIVSGTIQFRCQADSTPVRVALIFALEPAFAAGFAVLLIGEEPGPNALAGGLAIIVGVIAADAGPRLFRPEA